MNPKSEETSISEEDEGKLNINLVLRYDETLLIQNLFMIEISQIGIMSIKLMLLKKDYMKQLKVFILQTLMMINSKLI